jgi:MscS family membrane protein
MREFLNRIFWGNTVESYLWTIGVIILVLLLNRLISNLLAMLSLRLFQRRWKSIDQKQFVKLIIHPMGVFLVITVSIIAFYRLHFPPEFDFTIYKYSFQRVLLSLAITIQILSFVWLVMRLIDFISGVMQARADTNLHRAETQLIVFFRDFIKVILGIIAIMWVLHEAFAYDVTSLLTGLSIVGAAIALALRESLENLIASFVIFFDKPFTTGDFVKVQNVAGVIERIGLRSTRVRTTDKSYVTVPNKQMVDSILDNVSLRSQIRGEINLNISLNTSPAKIEQLRNEIETYVKGINDIKSSTVLFNDIRQQSYILFIEFFTPPIEWNQFTAVKQKINFFILQTMEKLEISIAADVYPAGKQ